MEIERKFLIKHIPDNLTGYPSEEIAQGYLPREEDGVELRVRQKGDTYYHTAKRGGGMVREEDEHEITRAEFEEYWQKTEGRRVAKTRYRIPYEQYVIEFDQYHGALKGLTTAEVEFPSVDEAHAFRAPAWFGREITDDRQYRNSTLAVQGLPKER